MSHSQDSLIGRRHSSLRSLPRVLQVCAGSLAGAPPLSPSRTASQQTEADLSRKTPAQGARPPSLLTETRPDQPTDPGLTPVRSQVGADISLPCDSESFTILLPLRLRGAETQKPQVRRPGAMVSGSDSLVGPQSRLCGPEDFRRSSRGFLGARNSWSCPLGRLV